MASPIEAALHAGIVRRAQAGIIHLYDCTDPESDEEYGTGDDIWSLFSGVSVLSYRVDFMLEGDGNNVRIAVECDGFDFHDRTKQQAAYDRSRDRELFAAGIPTARFTGSEIIHSVERCVESLFAFANEHRRAVDSVIRAWMAGFDRAQQLANAGPELEEHW